MNFNPANLNPANINPTSFRILVFLTGLLSILTVDALHNRSFCGNFCCNFTGIVSRETRFSASHQEQEDIDVGRRNTRYSRCLRNRFGIDFFKFLTRLSR